MAAVTAQNCIWGRSSALPRRVRSDGYLVKTVQQLRNERRPPARGTESVDEAKMIQISDETTFPLGGKRQRISPEIPLEGDDAERAHARDDHTQRGFSSSKARVQEAQAWHHDHHHGRGHDDVGRVSRRIPLIQIFHGYMDINVITHCVGTGWATHRNHRRSIDLFH